MDPDSAAAGTSPQAEPGSESDAHGDAGDIVVTGSRIKRSSSFDAPSPVSLFYLFNNLLGLGAGAWVTGLLSDGLAPRAGSDSLRYALCIMVVANLGSFVCYALGTRSFRADLERASR
jgi:hypothetical protein